MAITERGPSCGSTKLLRQKKKNLGNPPKDECTRLKSNSSQNVSALLRVHEMGAQCGAQIKSTAIVSEPKDDDECGDFSKQFGEEGWPDDYNCMWLSSGTPSPSKSCPRDYEFSGFLDFRPAHTFFDGSRVNPIEEASLVLGQKMSNDDQTISPDDSKEEEVVTWLVKSTGSESTDSHVSCFESPVSSCGQPFKEHSSCEYSFQFSTPGSDSDYASSEVFDLEEYYGSEKALFWPPDCKSDMGSEDQWEYFIMSPRKSKCNVGFPERKTSPEPLRLRVHKGKMDLDKECKRRLLFGPGSKSSRFVELNSAKGNKEVRRMTSMPSRLIKSSKKCMKIVPLDLEDEPAEAVVSEKPAIEYKQLWGKDFESNEELPIERMLGLDEFDGHEGVESDFNNANFSLEDLSEKNPL